MNQESQDKTIDKILKDKKFVEFLVALGQKEKDRKY